MSHAPPAPSLRLLYLDEHIAAVAKPSGMMVHPYDGHKEPGVEYAVSAARRLIGKYVYPVHRLDRGTSGVLLFATGSEAARALNEALERGEVDKRYLAIVRGVAPEAAIVDHPIPRCEGGPRVPAITEVRRLGVWERYSLVEARPRSGRFHQVRRHLKHLGHPIIGDVNYGRGEHNRFFRERFGLHRLCLHASSVSLAHPVTRAPIRIHAPLPEELAALFLEVDLSPL